MNQLILLSLFILFFLNQPQQVALIKSGFSQDSPSLFTQGIYLPGSSDYPSLNDSIEIRSDSLIVHKNPGYGYGVFFKFIYTYERINDQQLVLKGISHFMDSKPGTSFARVEEFEWHQDTLKVKYEANDVFLLFEGRETETYKLDGTKPHGH